MIVIPDSASMDRPAERPRGVSRKGVLLLGGALVLVVLAAFTVPHLRRVASVDRSVSSAALRFGAVTRGTLVRDASAQGRIVAALHPTLFAPVAGIVSLRVKAGATVAKGTLLAEIESPELKSRLMQERSTLASLESSLSRQRLSVQQAALRAKQAEALLAVKLEAAGRALERDERTFKEGLLNRIDFEKSKDDVRIATLELENARSTARLEAEAGAFDVRERELSAERQRSVASELARQVERLSITAPFDGVVATIAVQDRDAVAANGPVVTVVSLDAFEVEFQLAESYANDLAPGLEAQVQWEGKELQGHITNVSPEIADGLVKGTIAFDGEEPKGLRQSQRVSVRMVFEKKPGVLKVARGPFLEAGGGRKAYVVAGGVAEVREITTGAVSVSEVEILTGLREGEEIVLSDTAEFLGAARVLLSK